MFKREFDAFKSSRLEFMREVDAVKSARLEFMRLFDMPPPCAEAFRGANNVDARLAKAARSPPMSSSANSSFPRARFRASSSSSASSFSYKYTS
jgi:hypothetical protein